MTELVPTASSGAKEGDVLVIFGISGDLAKVMTFRSLYRLERRGLLHAPIVGVAFEDWTHEQLVERARESIIATGEDLDDAVFARLAARMSYVHGDFADAATYARVGAAIGQAKVPVYYLEVPPSLFATVIKGLATAELIGNGRVVVEKPFGHDQASATALAAELHQYVDESQLYRIDHYLGKLGLEEIVYLRFANRLLEPLWNNAHIACVQITMAEKFGVDDRGSFYDPVGTLRDVVVNHLMQIVAAIAMEPPVGGDQETLKDAMVSVFRSMTPADPAHYVRGQYEGYLDVTGVAPGSTTETFVALRLHVENWRWSGVPFYIRAGKELPVTQTEVRVVFKHPPQLGFAALHDKRDPNEVILRMDPVTGVRMILDARHTDTQQARPVYFDVKFSDFGGDPATPYEVLLLAALAGQSGRFTRQDQVDEEWRIMQPLLDAPPPVHAYPPGTWGPKEANSIVAGVTAWREPWTPDPS